MKELSKMSKVEKCKAMRDIVKGSKEYKKIGTKYVVTEKNNKPK